MRMKYIEPEITKVYIDTNDIMTQSTALRESLKEIADYDEATTYKISRDFWAE